MKKFGFTFYLILILLIAAFSASAENITLTGFVKDADGKPIEFATVKVQGKAIGTLTELDGSYKLVLAQADTIPMQFSCIGYREVKKNLINPKGDVTLNVMLPVADVMLDEVEVTAYRQNIGGMDQIDIKDIKLSPDVSGGSVEGVLTTMAGVNSSNEMSSQYSVRGGTYDENSVYINGTEIYRPQLVRSGQQEGLSIINPDMVGNIKFSTGGFPARYADKMSSALDITYREPEAFEAGITASLMGVNLYLGSNSGKFSQLHGFRYKKNNSLLSSLETKGEYNPSYLDYQTNLVWSPSNKFSINFLSNISSNHYNFAPADRETSFGTSTNTKKFKVYFDGEEKDRFDTYLGALNLNYRANSATDFSLGLSGFHTSELVSYDISGEYWLDQAGTSGEGSVGGELGVGKYMEHSRNRLKATVLQAILRGRTVIKNNHLSYGASIQSEKFLDRTREWEWRDSAGYSLPTAPEGVHLIYNLSSHQDLSTTRAAVYLEDSYYMNTDAGQFTLNGGVRFSWWSFNKETLFSPRLNMIFSPAASNRWRFRLAAGMYYQSPFYKEFRQPIVDELGNASVMLNKDIKSPRSIQVLIAADYDFRMASRPFKISAEAYYKNLSNLISYEYDNLKVSYTGVNDSKGYIMGLDFKLFGQFVPGSDSWVTFSLMKTQQDVGGVNTPLPSDQRYAFSLFFNDYFPKFPKLKFSLRGIFSDGLTMVAPRVKREVAWFRAPAYKRVDIGLSYQIVGAPDQPEPSGFWKNFRNVSVGVDIFNLFDISNVSSYYWVTDVNGIQYAVPNYLTRRQFNARLTLEF
ncbi:MAG: TonB-dependent receptor [Prevotella sp.]|nr:TonB-dependent receptor [Prevotella sp.]MCM1075655.1 TonB-dependent receptor [Ruminococcus sp.]